MTEERPAHHKWMERGVQNGWIGDYELELLSYIQRRYGVVPPSVETVLVFTSLFLKSGHTCLPLDKSPEEWISALDLDLKGAIVPPEPVIGELESFPATGAAGEKKLFILENNRFFFRRFWFFEKKLAELIRKRSSEFLPLSDPSKAKILLDEQFPKNETPGLNRQKLATALSLVKKLLVISGGPGTGKTSTLGNILILHQRLAGKQLKIALAAPTGKAANRMTSAINRSFELAGLSRGLSEPMPVQAVTLHRLLHKNRQVTLLPEINPRPLPFDLIIVDEASMADLSVMYHLFNSISSSARLILLGDKDQLSPVEAGAVFVELCRSSSHQLQEEVIEYLESLGMSNVRDYSGRIPETGERQTTQNTNESPSGNPDDNLNRLPSIVILDKNYRFSEESGIEKLKNAIQQSKPEEACRILESAQTGDLFCYPFSYSAEETGTLCRSRADHLQNCQEKPPGEILDMWLSHMWLSVRRNGSFGSRALNRMIEDYIIRQRLVSVVDGWYTGRPVLITRNDYTLGLFNGDLGVCRLDDQNRPWVWFPDPEKGLKKIHAQQTGEYEPAFIMTVHKSQGSEFENVTLLLPEKISAVLTRELIYTAVTRAGKTFTLYGNLKLLKEGLGRKSVRYSSLSEKISGY